MGGRLGPSAVCGARAGSLGRDLPWGLSWASQGRRWASGGAEVAHVWEGTSDGKDLLCTETSGQKCQYGKAGASDTA